MQIRIFLVFIFAFSLASCDKKEPITPACVTKCALAPDTGPCEAYFPKYYYDPNEKKCKEFIWGGCAGVIPFETLEECKACGCY